MANEAIISKILLYKKAATEEVPFDLEALVYKVLGKIFAIIAWQQTLIAISWKCEPNHAMALRTIFSAVTPGYFLNQAHGNLILFDIIW
jgi:predicted DNA-binding protein (MmcQ/YjbR family)